MLILSFMGFTDNEGGHTNTTVSCDHYEVYQRPDTPEGAPGKLTVTTYQKEISEGIERHISYNRGDHPSYDFFCSCFVTNLAGKTIDRIGPVKWPKHEEE